VFIHLDRPADKLGLLLQMLHKLYALVNQQCCEDNPDALTHHELLLPGHLLAKFAKEKLEDCLGAVKEAAGKMLSGANGAGVDLEVRPGAGGAADQVARAGEGEAVSGEAHRLPSPQRPPAWTPPRHPGLKRPANPCPPRTRRW
jgi:hypothetical protein